MCCCVTSGAEQAWKITVFLEIIYWLHQKFSLEATKSYWRDFLLNDWMKNMDFFCSSSSVHFHSFFFPNLGTIKRGKSYRTTSLEFFFPLNPTDTHVNDLNDGVFHTLAQPHIGVQACRFPGAAFAGGIFTEPWEIMWLLLQLLQT